MSDDRSDDDPFAALEADDGVEDPFAELDGTVGEGDDPFTEMDVGAAEPDDVWAELGDDTGEATGSDSEAIVPKRRYCEQCRQFSAPPDVACTNPGTEIRELVDSDHFSVYDCPVVARRRGDGTGLSAQSER